MKTIEWQDNTLALLDQSKLPQETVYIKCRSPLEVAEAIKTMKVRGAPAIGIAAAYGLLLGALEIKSDNRESFIKEIESTAVFLGSSRPTAVNLFWALERMLQAARSAPRGITVTEEIEQIRNRLYIEAEKMFVEDLESNRNIGRFGNRLVPQKASILTHCNAGALATTGYGTALGIVREAFESGKDIRVYADETRPQLQGARLTAWELHQDGIPVTLITDNMAGYLMQKGIIDLAVVGADRIAANGDVANKIGTYTVAVLCREHGIPFYVAAPVSTVDISLAGGEEIVIEERDETEVKVFCGHMIAPEGISVLNPAFDITPNHLVSAIITNQGILEPPYKDNIKKLFA